MNDLLKYLNGRIEWLDYRLRTEQDLGPNIKNMFYGKLGAYAEIKKLIENPYGEMDNV